MDCVFCKIISGEIPSKKVFENEWILAFDDIKPVHPVHVVIIPKKHIANVNEAGEADKEWLAQMMLAVSRVAKAKGVDQTGYRLVVNYGKDAGMSVNHLHIHLVGGEELPFATA